LAIGDPFVEDIEAQALKHQASFSSVCMERLTDFFAHQVSANGAQFTTNKQFLLPMQLDAFTAPSGSSDSEPNADVGVTFRDSLRQRVFGWYPYVEGFSASYTRDAILRYRPRTVYDPFGGSGTTQLAASLLGIPSFYSEINPFMSFVAETKVAASRWAKENLGVFRKRASQFDRYLQSKDYQNQAKKFDLSPFEAAFPARDFFEKKHLRRLLSAVTYVRKHDDFPPELKKIFLLACAANAVKCSNMTRRADLRRRRADEYKNRVVDVPQSLRETVARFVEDVEHLPAVMADTVRVSEDARAIPPEFNNAFDFALTSPPYLNGTNYFRNTKIELWLLGFIQSEEDLGDFRRRAISAGINNVTRDRPAVHTFDRVEDVVSRLERTNGDKRIPLLVRQYCSDMFELFAAMNRALTPGGAFLLDIGDSKFYGVHVPTDQLLVDAATRAGMTLEHRHVLARRYSRDKSELSQVELIFRKPKRTQVSVLSNGLGVTEIERIACEFQEALPYKEPPYSKRNWGHGLHSLCSYQGKLKPSMAHWLVRRFVPKRGRVLDPLGGVGTIPFEAALQGHEAVSNDKSPFASLVARAKLSPPALDDVEAFIEKWWREVESIPESEICWDDANFGLNGKVKDFYHPRTLLEVMRARTLFSRSEPQTDVEAFVWASLLHVLHGNRPYALSRTSHPITPFHPSGPAIYKSVLEKTVKRVKAALDNALPSEFKAGRGLTGDFRDLDRDEVGRFDAIITSPPFIGMRFDRPNWLRLWFCGWEEADFHKTSLGFLERQQTKSTNVYEEFFSKMHDLAMPGSVLGMHIGSGDDRGLVDDLIRLGDKAFRVRAQVRENVQSIEQHGIRDKGLTTEHHLVFFTPR